MKEEKKFWNEEMETLSPEGFRRVQEESLMKELDHVWENSLFYQEKLKLEIEKKFFERFDLMDLYEN